MSLAAIESLLENFQDPFLKTTWAAANVSKKLEQQGDEFFLELQFGYPFDESLIHEFQKIASPHKIHIKTSIKIDAHVGQPGLKGLPNVKNIIAIASGK